MKVLTFENSLAASNCALELFRMHLSQGATVFGLATGSTPETLYQLMAQSDLDFSQATSINLDEYYGLAADHPKSYHYYMQQHLFQFKPFAHSYLPDGLATDSQSEITRYNQIIKTHSIDLQLLGLGQNGHIGFNEPGASFDARTQLVDLTPSTIQANSRFFSDIQAVPTQAYSMGIASILSAKHILLLAFGQAKAQAVKAMIEGPVTEDLPASALQTHPDVTILLDQAAAQLLKSN